MSAEAWHGESSRRTTTANLTFVALDQDTGKPTEVPPLAAETDDERRRQAQARIRREIRKERIERLGSWRSERAPARGDAPPRGSVG